MKLPRKEHAKAVNTNGSFRRENLEKSESLKFQGFE
jgi:hypothetical protein